MATKGKAKGKDQRKCLMYSFAILSNNFPAGNYMFKVKNRNTSKRCEICSKLTIKLPERRKWLQCRKIPKLQIKFLTKNPHSSSHFLKFRYKKNSFKNNFSGILSTFS